MQEVEKQFHEDAYGGLKAREARLKERHDQYVQNREAEDIRRIAQLKVAEKVIPKRQARLARKRMCTVLHGTAKNRHI